MINDTGKLAASKVSNELSSMSSSVTSNASKLAVDALSVCLFAVTLEAFNLYQKWNDKKISDSEYLAEIMTSGGNAVVSKSITSGIMLHVSSVVATAGMSSMITFPIGFVVGAAVDKIVAPCFGRGEYKKILSQAKYYQNLETFYRDMISSIQDSAGHYVKFLNGVKSQQSFHENAKKVSMSLNKDLEALYNSI